MILLLAMAKNDGFNYQTTYPSNRALVLKIECASNPLETFKYRLLDSITQHSVSVDLYGMGPRKCWRCKLRKHILRTYVIKKYGLLAFIKYIISEMCLYFQVLLRRQNFLFYWHVVIQVKKKDWFLLYLPMCGSHF